MIGDSAPWPLGKRNAFLAIAVGGLIAGTLDLTKLASYLDGTFRSRLPGACWGGGLSMEA
jgi:hypothetical protein